VLSSDHAYRARLSQKEALGELETGAGTQFDPTVVAALVAELDETEYDF
jgi:response regulator RpfG family c-di-GMP phosphodiesterase